MSLGSDFLHRTVVPLGLMSTTPLFAILLVYTAKELDGSYATLFSNLASDPRAVFAAALAWPGPLAWRIIGAFAAFELALLRLVPGRVYLGPVTPMGNRPVYTANGLQAFFITLAAYLAASGPLGLFERGIVYVHFKDIITACVISGLIVAAVLVVKVCPLYVCLVGVSVCISVCLRTLPYMRVFCVCMWLILLCVCACARAGGTTPCMLLLQGIVAPSSTDASSSGNYIFDYYCGTELYPRICGFDVKVFVNCRFGMMGWAVIILDYAGAQLTQPALNNGVLANSLFVSVALQLVYIAKFFWWESGYMASMDIQHDRAGFYLLTGCTMWVPSVYTSASLYLVNHPVQLPTAVAVAVFLAGWAAIFVNFDADNQRQYVRSVDGKCDVWGRPAEVVRVQYRTADGETKRSLLVACGWWGIASHFHYIPELTAAFLWSAPGGFVHAFPFFYFAFLTVLLTHRAFRDDERCAEKYGEYWTAYRRRVPYKIIPGIL
jgi:7-dehydrocholesterol reductase